MAKFEKINAESLRKLKISQNGMLDNDYLFGSKETRESRCMFRVLAMLDAGILF